MPPFLNLDRLAKSFGGERVLEDLTLAVDRGEILALLGPSGSGKTTALRTVAGFEAPDSGRIAVEGRDVTDLPPARRNFGMVFQHYALFPHLTVGGNVAFGLEARGMDRLGVARRVGESLALVDLAGFESRKVGEISGGQQQRVALARALAPEPRVLLLDEPLSNLDPALRERTRRELRRAIRRVGITTLLVTHEQEEAFELGDRVAVLWRGRLQQVGRPEELYERPATRFVATFVGRANVLPGSFEPARGDESGRTDNPRRAVPGGGAVEAAREAARESARDSAQADGRGGSGNDRRPGGAVRFPEGTSWPGIPGEELAPGAPVELIVRPEALAFRPAGEPGALSGRVAERRYAGPVSYYQVALATGPEVEVLAPSGAVSLGETVHVAPQPGAAAAPRIFRRERRPDSEVHPARLDDTATRRLEGPAS